MLEKIPKQQSVTLDNHRFELPVSLSVPWLRQSRKAVFVPLYWKRAVMLPASMSLEAWYLANLDASEEWSLDPEAVIAGTVPLNADDLAEAQSLIHRARISNHKGRTRVTIPKLLTTFAAQSGTLASAKIMVTLEKQSLSVWTYSAFQTHFGSISA